MKKISLISLFALVSLLGGCNSNQTPTATVSPSNTAPTTTTAETPKNTTEDPTLKNLQTAYNGESNANVMYLAFAKKADEEGYKEVGSLFRAAARAEAIHRDNHAKVIQEMGGTPTNKIATPVVKTTAENLAQAIKGESYERDTMYPDFIKQATTENNQPALETLNYALEAEAGHAQLYSEAEKNLVSWKQPQSFYVCSVSGITTMKAEENSCTFNGTKAPVETVN